MSTDPASLGRRRFAQLAALTSLAVATPLSVGAVPATAAPTGQDAAGGPGAGGAPDDVAAAYYQALLTHTRWAETQWDAKAGSYARTDYNFVVVLGNAVLLTRGTYDAASAGVDKETLRSHTLATIRHFAASNRLTGGTEWGKTLFFDTTFQLYFVLAARLLWDQLDAVTQGHVDTIVREQAAYTTALGNGNDPASGSWTPNGAKGGFVGDTKLEEMGVYAQSLAPGLAWAADDPRFGDWSAAYGRWSRNETGLPAADLANPAVVDGVAVSANTAQNLYDTFIVENHGSFGPHYQQELWRTSGRNAAHFLTAGRPLPEVLTAQPNAEQLWRTLLMVMSDAGEPLMPMVADREHLYGRDVIPLAFLAQVAGDRAAAWGEAALAARLAPYQAYAPLYRLAKFSGEAKYEPEARAEVAISYLLHEWRAAHGGVVEPLSDLEMFQRASGVQDFGDGPGLVAHQTPAAWAGSVSKPGFVKFGWQPAHDDWLFALSGVTPMFLPATAAKVLTRTVATYRQVRDGFDATATLLTLDSGRAGFTTLPSGAVVYATSGTAAGEGSLRVQNLTMPGVAGLDGSRTYTAAEGSAQVASQDSGNSGAAPGPRVDNVTVPAGSWRYVRMQGVAGHPTYGYSLYAFEVREGADGPDLAQAATATASSADTGKGAALAVDGSLTTRWAVAVADRGRSDSWLTVDLGAARAFDRVTLRWETAAARAYRVQGSADGRTWTDLARFPQADLSSRGNWLSVDGRAGLVVRGAANPLSVYGDLVLLSDGPAEPLLVEGLPSGDPGEVRAAAALPAPTAQDTAVKASTAGGHLSLFNLSADAVTTTVSVPQSSSEPTLYAGTQQVTAAGTDVAVELAGATAAVVPARFTLTSRAGGAVPAGLRVEVVDAATVRISGPSARLLVTAPSGASAQVDVQPGRTAEVSVAGVAAYPLADVALGRNTFPTAPRPAGMSDPAAAVDGNPATSWRPGSAQGRMVVDLGGPVDVREIRTVWTPGRVPATAVEFSTDGLAYSAAGELRRRGLTAALGVGVTARYVALAVTGGRDTDARLVSLEVVPA
ncbi:discoidin domain-containing protein [Streptomyces cocklensis]|uniref:F5/8 type C domain-containing protein n=1 Tax=Actinacidiphila cocklensis TaxID=887465 RepID=A0A9W4DIE5_9ACTN|nr:discoidin domain-containing protein [Actinacidiphila cocklensis]MDD1058538.1 discoidin domain-containing protein [Actinacidiphila cocklensis]CAG6390707.1 F5/8 type C domain-containing protein [Actinacidiphila cocklensis]